MGPLYAHAKQTTRMVGSRLFSFVILVFISATAFTHAQHIFLSQQGGEVNWSSLGPQPPGHDWRHSIHTSKEFVSWYKVLFVITDRKYLKRSVLNGARFFYVNKVNTESYWSRLSTFEGTVQSGLCKMSRDVYLPNKAQIDHVLLYD